LGHPAQDPGGGIENRNWDGRSEWKREGIAVSTILENDDSAYLQLDQTFA
jgi:hypothetical protein